jgi:hypothetical protein
MGIVPSRDTTLGGWTSRFWADALVVQCRGVCSLLANHCSSAHDLQHVPPLRVQPVVQSVPLLVGSLQLLVVLSPTCWCPAPLALQLVVPKEPGLEREAVSWFTHLYPRARHDPAWPGPRPLDAIQVRTVCSARAGWPAVVASWVVPAALVFGCLPPSSGGCCRFRVWCQLDA